METGIATVIERWFDNQDDESDFVRPDRSMVYSLIPPMAGSGKFVYTTKPGSVAHAIERSGASVDLGMIGRYGLPSDDEVSWLRDAVGPGEIWFLGDMDPVDLLIFAWLRARLAPTVIQHLGVSDRYLESLSIEPRDAVLIPLSASETESLPLLAKALPDLDAIIGPRFADLLKGLRKFELEAAMHGPSGVAGLLMPLPKA